MTIDALTAVRAAILKTINLNPHNYAELASYQHLLRKERALVAVEADRTARLNALHTGTYEAGT